MGLNRGIVSFEGNSWEQKGKINWFLTIMYREKGSMESVEISEIPIATESGVGG